jgi:Ice-binding-like
MTLSTPKTSPNASRSRPRSRWATIPLALVLLGMLLTLVSGASAAATAVSLGTADSFAVLAGSGITNTGPTTVNGDLGTYPTTTFSGSASVTVTGTSHTGDAVTQGAKTDLVTAYNTAAGEGPTSPITADLAGQTLTPGVYNSASSIGLSGTLTLNGSGDPNSVFVFQAGSTLTTGSASNISLINGAQACNIFWQVGSSATLGTGSTFQGTVIALTSITVTTGVTVNGRVLARNGAVTLDTDTITRTGCAAPTTTTATVDTAAAAAATAQAAATQATAAQAAAAQAVNVANASAAKAAAAKAAAAAAKARTAAEVARRLAATTKATAVKAAAARALAAANAARRAAAKAAVLARVATKKAAASTHPVAKPARQGGGFTG